MNDPPAGSTQILSSSVTMASTSLFNNDTGSSLAAPHVAGAIALLRQKYPIESNQFIFDQLYQSGVPVPLRATGMSARRIDMVAALYNKDFKLWRELLPTTTILLQ